MVHSDGTDVVSYLIMPTRKVCFSFAGSHDISTHFSVTFGGGLGLAAIGATFGGDPGTLLSKLYRPCKIGCVRTFLLFCYNVLIRHMYLMII